MNTSKNKISPSMLQFNKSSLYLWIPVLIILCPIFPTLTDIGPQVVFLLNIIILIWCYYEDVFTIKTNIYTSLIFCYILGCTGIDIIKELLDSTSTPNDFLEILRPIGLLLFYYFYRYSKINIVIIEKYSIQILTYLFIFEGIYCILEFFLPDIFRNISYLLWKREDVAILKNKALGSFFQTYNFAFILLLPYTYSFLLFLNKYSIKTFMFYVIIAVTLLLTQSRSMYISMLIISLIALFSPINFRTAKSTVFTLTIFSSILIGCIYLYVIYYQELSEMLSYAFTGFDSMSTGTNNSVNTRMEQIDWALNNNQFYLIGYGIGKSQILLESLYSLYYYRYGVIGLILFFTVVYITAKRAYYIVKNIKIEQIKLKIFYYSLFSFYLITPFSLLSSCHNDSPKISLLFYGFIGLIFSKYNLLKSETQNSLYLEKICKLS